VKVEILVVTHAKDLPYLRWCLQSIKKFGSGFTGVTLVYPEQEREQFDRAQVGKHWCVGALLLREFDQFPGKGMLDHMAQKMMADIHCPEADYILHVDSDCVFREAFKPEDYFEPHGEFFCNEDYLKANLKPVLLIEPYEVLKTKHPGRYHWKSVVEAMLGLPCEYETMCRHPMVNPRGVYAPYREFLERRWKLPFRHYYLTGNNAFPQSICEFNSLGAFWITWEHQPGDGFSKCPWHLIDLSKKQRPKDKLVQFWSHSPPDKPQEIWIDGKEVVVVPEVLIKEILA